MNKTIDCAAAFPISRLSTPTRMISTTRFVVAFTGPPLGKVVNYSIEIEEAVIQIEKHDEKM